MKKANSLFLNLYTNTIMCGLDNSFVWPSFPSSIQQEMSKGVSTSFLLKHDKFLSYKTPKINGQEEIQTKQWPHQTWRLEQVPLTGAPCIVPPWIPHVYVPPGLWQPCDPPSPLSTSLPGSGLSHWPRHPGTSWWSLLPSVSFQETSSMGELGWKTRRSYHSATLSQSNEQPCLSTQNSKHKD